MTTPPQVRACFSRWAVSSPGNTSWPNGTRPATGRDAPLYQLDLRGRPSLSFARLDSVRRGFARSDGPYTAQRSPLWTRGPPGDRDTSRSLEPTNPELTP